MLVTMLVTTYIAGFFFWFFICGLTNTWNYSSHEDKPFILVGGAFIWPISWLVLLICAIYKTGVAVKEYRNDRTYK